MNAWKTQTARGMTLLELLVVIIIIGILAGFLIPATVGMRNRAAETRARGARALLRTAILNYHAEYDRWPVSDQETPTREATSEIIKRLRPPHSQNTRHLIFWEGENAVRNKDNEEYLVTINPRGKYPVNPSSDFSSDYMVYFTDP